MTTTEDVERAIEAGAKALHDREYTETAWAAQLEHVAGRYRRESRACVMAALAALRVEVARG